MPGLIFSASYEPEFVSVTIFGQVENSVSHIEKEDFFFFPL